MNSLHDAWEFFVGVIVGVGGTLGFGWLDAFRNDGAVYRRGYAQGSHDGYQEAIAQATEVVRDAVHRTTV